MVYELKKVVLDGEPAIKLCCPKCGQWGYIDDEQYHGRISIQCENCSFHETIDLSKAN